MNATRTTLSDVLWRWQRGIARACRWRHDGAVIPGGKRGLSPVACFIAAVLTIFVFAPSEAEAAVAFDATSTASSSATPYSFTHTPVGTPTTVVVGVAIRENLTTVSGITYGGVAMTFVRADLVALAARNEIWILNNPPAGAQTVTVTLVAAQQTASISVTVTGSATAGQPANHAGATGTSTAPSATVVSAAGRLVIGFVHSQRSNTDVQIAVGAGQTQRASIGGPTLNRPRQEATDEAGAASVVTNWTLTTSTSWTAQGVDLSAPTAVTTTIGDGTNPGNATIAPGAAATNLDSFTLQTSAGADTVTAATVTLAAGTFAGISLVEITNDNGGIRSGATVYGSVANPAAAAVSFTLMSIPVSTTLTTFRVWITPKSHAAMPAPPGASYAVTGTVTSFTSTNAQAGTDTGSATVTIDNLSPSNVTGATATSGDAQVTLAWTNPAGDFSNVVILRKTATITDVPAEGSAPAVDTLVGTSTVRYILSGTTFTDTGLTNGTQYFYRIFAKDTSGNYSATGVEVSATPAAPPAPTFNQSAYRLFNNADSTDVGTALAAQDTAATLGSTGAAFRLRLLLHVGVVNLGINGQAFKLQFVGKGTGTCAAPTGGTPAAYTDVTAATVIAYNNNATPADGATLTANANDPTHLGVAAVAIDASSSTTGVGVASVTWAHTTSGADRLLIVGVSFYPSTVSGVTYGGVAMTSVGSHAGPPGMHMWRLVAPATGANNIVVTFAGATDVVAGATSFTGVNQTTPLGTFVSALGTGNISVVVTSASGDIVIDTLSTDGTTEVVGAGQTQRWNLTAGATAVNGNGSTEPGAATVTMSWTGLFAGDTSTLGAVSVKPSAADIVVNQTYEELNNFTNPTAINIGQDGKWDFALKDNGAPGSTAYCFRVVKDTGAVLDTYTVIPEITTATAAAAAGSFNAYESATAAGAITGVIKTKIAGAAVSLDMIALNVAKTAIMTTFTGTVRVEVLNASNNTGALDGNNCRSTWTVIQTLSPDPAFAAPDNGRKAISFTEANSYPDARLRITFPAGAPTVTGCSTDNFAIRPNTLASFIVTDTDWQTAGLGRVLSDVTFGTVTHKAGRPLSVSATARNAAGTPATTTNYAGAPTATLTACVGAACTATFGTLTLTTTFALGALTSDVASYNDVGSFALQLVDSAFASVDAADGSTTTERNITSAVINVGRFVPDHFAVSLNTPVFGTACGSFTYIGRAFNYTTPPVITVTAQGFANNTTTLYATSGSWWRITNADITPATQGARYSAATGTLDVTGLPAVVTDPVIVVAGSGMGTLTFSSGTGLLFTRTTPTAPASPYDADISLAINVIDADGVILASNPARFGTATAGNGIAFSSGKPMRFGRLTLRNANGSQLVPLPVQLEAQYWLGAPTNAFVTHTADSCTSIAAGNVAMSNFTQNLAACETAISGGGVLSAGRKTLQLAAPGSANNGSVDLTVNLGASASGNTCTAVGAGPGPLTTTANLPYLQGNWTGVNYDQNPTARAAFGVFKGAEEVIFIRENF